MKSEGEAQKFAPVTILEEEIIQKLQANNKILKRGQG